MSQTNARSPTTHRILAFLRCASCRFAALYFISFYFGLLSIGIGGVGWALFGCFYWLVFTLATEVLNRCSDRREDRINRPERTGLCDEVGYSALARTALYLWLGVLLLDALWLLARPNPLLAVLLFLGAFSSLNYSFGLRLKVYPVLSQFVLTFPFFGTFLIGWSLAFDLSAPTLAWFDFVHRILPFLAAVMLFMGIFASVKDLTDFEGDERVGFRSILNALLLGNSRRVAVALALVPALFVLVLVALRWLPVRFLTLVALAPFSVVTAVAVQTAEDRDDRLAVREMYYNYLYGYISLALLLLRPTADGLAVAGLSALYWLLTSRWLHWTDGVRLWKLRLMVRFALPGSE